MDKIVFSKRNETIWLTFYSLFTECDLKPDNTGLTSLVTFPVSSFAAGAFIVGLAFESVVFGLFTIIMCIGQIYSIADDETVSQNQTTNWAVKWLSFTIFFSHLPGSARAVKEDYVLTSKGQQWHVGFIVLYRDYQWYFSIYKQVFRVRRLPNRPTGCKSSNVIAKGLAVDSIGRQLPNHKHVRTHTPPVSDWSLWYRYTMAIGWISICNLLFV